MTERHSRKLRRIVLLILIVVIGLFLALGKTSPLKNFSIEGMTPVQWVNVQLEKVFPLSEKPEPLKTTLENPLVSVYVLDVGQGEAILIRTPQGDLLIDGGETNRGKQVVDSLRQLGVNRLELLIASHPHSDHMGGLTAVIDQLEIGQILLPEIPDELIPTSRSFTDFLEAIDRRGYQITTAEAGASYTFGPQVTLTVIGPVAEGIDLNNQSVVLRLESGETSFLFTGDLEAWGEEQLLGAGVVLKADVLSLGHHGSNTSTSAAFLEAVSPQIGVLSCGADNAYGHPHREVLERLRNKNIACYRTDQMGTLLIQTDGKQLAVVTETDSAKEAA